MRDCNMQLNIRKSDFWEREIFKFLGSQLIGQMHKWVNFLIEHMIKPNAHNWESYLSCKFVTWIGSEFCGFSFRICYILH